MASLAWIDIWMALAIVCLALGALTVAIAYVEARRHLPRGSELYAPSRDAFTFWMSQAAVPQSVRYKYVSGLCLMALAPYVGLLDALLAPQPDLVWPFIALCTIVTFATIVSVTQVMGRREPIP